MESRPISEDDTLPVSRRRRGRAATRSGRSGNLPTTIRRKKTNKLYIAASVVIAVLVIASFAFASFSGGGGGGATRGGSSQAYVDGVGTQIPILAPNHIPEGAQASYNSQPATSGEHWPVPAQCGFYEEQLPDERVVHNLEHGNIVVSYNFVLDSDVSVLRDALNDIGLNRVWGVARIYDQIPEGQVALTAWGVMDVFPGVDPDRIARFFEAYAGGLGPERFPC